ncbi:MAG: ECF transporter S component, partial [Treponemataceae bacterium]|nr:ECF transporter S component [Treponemataceae bacterium]
MQKKVLRSAIVAFFAAIICATGFFRVPVPGIQQGILIQNAKCVLTAVLLGGVAGV